MTKNTKSLAIIFILLLSLFQCSDQNIDDPNSANEETATIQTLVTGIEGGMRIDLQVFLRVVSMFGRECYFIEPSDPRYVTELLVGPIDNNGFLLTRHWDGRYRTIKNCNVLLANAENLAFTSAEQNGAEGFARTMLGYQLLMVLNYLDDNGIRVDVASDPIGSFVSKSEALSSIANYLDEGFSNLGSAGDSFWFDLSDGFSAFDTPETFRQFNRALRARVALYQNDYQGALDALAGSFINSAASMDLGAYHSFGTGAGDRINLLFEKPDAISIKYYGHPSFATDSESGDSRFAEKVVQRENAIRYEGLESDLGVTLYDSSTAPIPIIRNEELLLIRAEAQAMTNGLASAEADINAVRSAAGLENLTLADQSAAMDQLLWERRYSLFGEGHRWVDMRRWGRLSELPLDREGDIIVEMMPVPFNEIN